MLRQLTVRFLRRNEKLTSGQSPRSATMVFDYHSNFYSQLKNKIKQLAFSDYSNLAIRQVSTESV